MSRLRLISMILTLILCLGACSLQRENIHAQANNSSEFSMTCSHFTGTRQTSIAVADGSSATLYGAVDRSDGSCSILIFQEDGSVIYSGEDIFSTSFRLMLEGGETYYISIDCSRYSGSYNFTWDFVGSGAIIEVPDELVVPEENAQPSSPPANPGVETAELWEGRFYCEELDATALLHRTDENFCQVSILYADTVLAAIAQISTDAPYEAFYTGPSGLSFTFYRSGSLLEITQSEQTDSLNLSGNYLIQAEE